ncbi:MAG: hypothetical protein WBO28_12205, partial [Flavobacteriales bacterium]
ASVAPSRRCGGNFQKTLRIRCAVASLRWKLSENVAHPLRRRVVAVETFRKRCASVAPSRRCGGNFQKTLRIRCAVASLRWKLSENVAHPLRRRVVAVETLKHAGLP